MLCCWVNRNADDLRFRLTHCCGMLINLELYIYFWYRNRTIILLYNDIIIVWTLVIVKLFIFTYLSNSPVSFCVITAFWVSWDIRLSFRMFPVTRRGSLRDIKVCTTLTLCHISPGEVDIPPHRISLSSGISIGPLHPVQHTKMWVLSATRKSTGRLDLQPAAHSP